MDEDSAAVAAAVEVRNSASLRSTFSWTLLGNLVYAASQWAILMLLAKLGSTALVGRYSLGLAVAAPIILFSNLGLRTVQATDARHEVEFSGYLGARLVTSVLGLVAVIVMVISTPYDRGSSLAICAIGVAKSIESICDICYGAFLKYDRTDLMGKSLLLRAALSLPAAAAALLVSGSAWMVALALAVVWALVLSLYDLKQAARLDPTRNRRDLIRTVARELSTRVWWRERFTHLLLLSLPVGVVATLTSLIPNVPRYFLERTHGAESLGIYSALAYLMVAGSTVVNALGLSAMPRLARLYTSRPRQDFVTLALRLVGIGAAMGGAAVLLVRFAGPQLITVLYTREYAQHQKALLLITTAAAAGFMASFLWYGVSAARQFRTQVPVFSLVILAGTAVSYFIVPRYGIVGAAAATTTMAVVQLLLISLLFYRTARANGVPKSGIDNS